MPDRQTDRQTTDRHMTAAYTTLACGRNYSASKKTPPPKYNGVVFEILGKHH